ncbi:MAG: HAMP domain-containing histidine kinase [Elusimicrobia bacterium]|nr:HAMP domain-containing histidine kinase [Elusimicrobiota bacterium]
MKIRTFTGLTVGAAVAFTFVVAWLAAAAGSAFLLSSMVAQEHERHAAALAAVAQASLAGGESRGLREYVRTLPASVPRLEYAFVESDGKIVAHSDPRFVGASGDAWKASYGKTSEIERPVTWGSSSARACVGVQADAKRAALGDLVRFLLPSIVLVGAGGILLAAALGLSLAVFLSRPVISLADAAEEVGKGNLSVQVPVTSSSEFGQLAHRFNEMVMRLRTIDDMKDASVASVSHDLRTPLVAIQMALDFMLHDDPDHGKILPKHRQTLAGLAENASRLGVFISNILDAAKIKAGRMECHPRPVSLAAILKSLEALYGPFAANEGIALRLDLPADLPSVSADAERLERAISNLLSNSLKFTPSGGSIVVSARASGGVVELSVKDTGQGIDRTTLGELFQPFQQGSASSQRASLTHGTGLGLFIIKESMESMGGEIEVESEPGAGTRISLRLAQAKEAEEMAEAGGRA